MAPTTRIRTWDPAITETAGLVAFPMAAAPAINTGIAHKDAGIGQIGAGLSSAPMQYLVEALEALVRG